MTSSDADSEFVEAYLTAEDELWESIGQSYSLLEQTVGSHSTEGAPNKVLDKWAAMVSRERERFQDGLRERREQVINLLKLDERTDNFEDMVRRNTEKLKERTKELQLKAKRPAIQQWLDKFMFTVGVINMLVTQAVALQAPQWMVPFYTFWIVTLMIMRWIIYHRNKWHYFLLDFCYFTQCIMGFYLFLYPMEDQLFTLIFALSNGPLAWAIIVWGNAVVFHDLDKMTSIFIHIFPPIVTWTLRWSDLPGYSVCSTEECTLEWRYSLLLPFLMYLFWQVAYYLKTEYVDKEKLEKDGRLQTSLRWLSASRKSFVHKILAKTGTPEEYHVLIFMAGQSVYTILTILPIKFMFEHYWANTAWLIFIVWQSVWNGAGFYFEKFYKRYADQLAARIVKYEEAKLEHESGGSGSSSDENGESSASGGQDDDEDEDDE